MLSEIQILKLLFTSKNSLAPFTVLQSMITFHNEGLFSRYTQSPASFLPIASLVLTYIDKQTKFYSSSRKYFSHVYKSLEKAPRPTVWVHLNIFPMCYAFLFCVTVISKISTILRVLVCTCAHTQSLSLNFLLTTSPAERHQSCNWVEMLLNWVQQCLF